MRQYYLGLDPSAARSRSTSLCSASGFLDSNGMFCKRSCRTELPAASFTPDGYPGAVDGYQVNFQLPSATASGTATIQLSAAWIQGPAVNVPVQ